MSRSGPRRRTGRSGSEPPRSESRAALDREVADFVDGALKGIGIQFLVGAARAAEGAKGRGLDRKHEGERRGVGSPFRLSKDSVAIGSKRKIQGLLDRYGELGEPPPPALVDLAERLGVADLPPDGTALSLAAAARAGLKCWVTFPSARERARAVNELIDDPKSWTRHSQAIEAARLGKPGAGKYLLVQLAECLEQRRLPAPDLAGYFAERLRLIAAGGVPPAKALHLNRRRARPNTTEKVLLQRVARVVRELRAGAPNLEEALDRAAQHLGCSFETVRKSWQALEPEFLSEEDALGYPGKFEFPTLNPI